MEKEASGWRHASCDGDTGMAEPVLGYRPLTRAVVTGLVPVSLDANGTRGYKTEDVSEKKQVSLQKVVT